MVILVSFLISLFSSSLLYHPIHVSVTNMEYNNDERRFNISMRIFKDDLDGAISHAFDTLLYLTETTGQLDNVDLIKEYMDHSFQMHHGNKQLPIILTHHELTDDAILLNLTCDFSGNASSLKIRNSVLMDFYHDQTNLVIFSFSGKEKGLRFTTDAYVQTVKLE